MRRATLAIGLWLVALVQAYFISAASGGRFSVNLVLVVLFYVALQRSLRLGILLAAWAGLWLDIAGGQLGPRILLLVASVLLVGWVMKLGLEMDRRLTQFLVL